MREWIRNEPKPNVSKVRKIRNVRGPDEPLPDHCCATCRHWRKPFDADADPFGSCRAVGMVSKRSPRGPDVGTAITVDQLNRMTYPPIWEPMRTREWFASCSEYAAGSGGTRDRAGDRQQFVQGSLFEAVAERRDPV